MFIVPITRMQGVESLEQVSPIKGQTGKVKENAFEDALSHAISQVEEAQQDSEEADALLVSGGVDDLHTAMIKAEQSAAAVEFTTQLTSRVVSAYNQIMNMQV